MSETTLIILSVVLAVIVIAVLAAALIKVRQDLEETSQNLSTLAAALTGVNWMPMTQVRRIDWSRGKAKLETSHGNHEFDRVIVVASCCDNFEGFSLILRQPLQKRLNLIRFVAVFQFRQGVTSGTVAWLLASIE